MPAACAASLWKSAPLRAAERADLLQRLQHADLVVGGHHRDDGGALVDRRGQRREIDETLGVDRQHADAAAFARHRLDAFEHAFMLGRHGDDVIAPQRAVEARGALDREVVGFGRARGEDDLARLGTDQRGDLAASLLHRFRGFAAIGMRRRMRVAELLGEPGQHLLEHAPVDRRRRLVVEIDRRRVGPGLQAGERRGHAAFARVRA